MEWNSNDIVKHKHKWMWYKNSPYIQKYIPLGMFTKLNISVQM
jgi:hypothetical protein